MTARLRARAAGIFVVCAVAGVTAAASADDAPASITPSGAASAPTAAPTIPTPEKALCVSELDQAQSAQGAHRLKSARASLVACSSEACPEVVREDCARTLVQVDDAMPSAVFSASVDGADAVAVRVVVDGQLVSDHIDGRAVTFDPGAHVARFIAKGREPLDVRFVAREGEKDRIVGAAFGSPKPIEPAAKPRAEGSRPFPMLPVILAGTGALALGSGLGLRLSADSMADDMRSTCAPTCDPGQRDSLSDRLVMSNVSFTVGAVALAAAGVLWLVESKH